LEAKNSIAYYRIHAYIYDFTRPFFLFGRRKAVRAMRIRNGDYVVEYACGTGTNIRLLRQWLPPNRILGVDLSPDMLARARRKHRAVEFVEADVTTFVPTDPADSVLCAYAISLIPHWEEAILRMKEAIYTDGRVVILDFHPWRGPLRIFYPLMRTWLRLHGVDAELPIEAFLRQHFAKVTTKTGPFGYYGIWIGEQPLETEPNTAT
jgi:S-adenosylmethionine-diacylgycerolhomoserine-N-methlytransferase